MTMMMNTSAQGSSGQPRSQIHVSQSIFDQVFIGSGTVKLHNQYKSIVSSVFPERYARCQVPLQYKETWLVWGKKQYYCVNRLILKRFKRPKLGLHLSVDFFFVGEGVKNN